MLHIAVCDDEQSFLDRLAGEITAYLTEKSLPFELDSFSSGEALFRNPEKTWYDIAFLDISMDEVDGLETARRLIAVNKKICIVLVTGHMEYVLEGYKVGALRYLVKDSLDSCFRECMEAAVQKFHIDTDEIRLEFIEKTAYLNVSEICLVESKGHKLIFLSAHDQGVIGTMYRKLTEIKHLLGGRGFLRVHQSYLVNMRYIVNISSYFLELQQKITLHIPKNRYQYVKREYALYQGDLL